METALGMYTWVTVMIGSAALLSLLFRLPARRRQPEEMAALCSAVKCRPEAGGGTMSL